MAMPYTATIYALVGSTVTCRIRDNASWWTGTAWSAAIADAASYSLTAVTTGGIENFYYVSLSLPTATDGSLTIEYLSSGLVIADETITDGTLVPNSYVPSDVSTYNPTQDVIVKASLRMVGAYASTDTPRAEQLADAVEALNLMLKSWQIDAFMWLRKFAVVTLAASTRSYLLGNGSTVAVYEGTSTYIDRPTRIFSAVRRDTSGYDVPLIALSRDDYMRIPNKTTTGTVTQYYYDPQLTQGVLYLWPTPATGVTDTVVLNCDRGIADMLADTNNYDCPQQWLEVIKYGLATRLAPEYGIPLSERQLLEQEYMALRQRVESTNIDYSSTFFGYGR